jgi:RNA polymerase sigma-70 factor (ECF subfamily)
MDKNYLEGVTIEGGKFRNYLLKLLKHFLADERERERALKRGGGQTLLSIDEESEETRYQIEPVENITPEILFERTWAAALLNEVMGKLRREYVAEGNAELFEALRPCLTGAEPLLPYAELGRVLGMKEGAVKQAVHRLRRRYGQLLRTEIADTVDSPEEIESEIRHLITVASGSVSGTSRA